MSRSIGPALGAGKKWATRHPFQARRRVAIGHVLTISVANPNSFLHRRAVVVRPESADDIAKRRRLGA